MQKSGFGKRIRQLARGNAGDSLLLTFVKIVSAVLGLLTTKLLSVRFSLEEYGTYSQAMLLVSTVTSITILGLTDATNYFYNTSDSDEVKQEYISTVFGIQYLIGLVSAALVCACTVPIAAYFGNDGLRRILLFAAWMPVLNNLIPMLQVLYVSIGRAKAIAVRNFLVSAARLGFVAVASYVTKNVLTIFVLILILDVAQVVYFQVSFSRSRFPIRITKFRRGLIRPILTFCIPMAVFVFTNALSRDIDKYVIGYFTDTETLGIYTNAAKVLPFDLLTASFLTVLVPVITRQVRGEEYGEAQRTLRSYLRVGYLFTWVLVAGAIVNAPEMMKFFYDEKYLPGLPVFVVYLVVDMMRFANTSLVLSAKGKTRTLMTCSLVALGANAILNVLTFRLFGIIGPAITTLAVTVALMTTLLILSAKEIGTSFFALFDWREIAVEVAELAVVAALAYGLKLLLYKVISSYVVVLILAYGVFLGVMFLLSKKRIWNCLEEINR